MEVWGELGRRRAEGRDNSRASVGRMVVCRGVAYRVHEAQEVVVSAGGVWHAIVVERLRQKNGRGGSSWWKDELDSGGQWKVLKGYRSEGILTVYEICDGVCRGRYQSREI